jgi:ABC-2 type transport system permease protein
LEQKKQLEQGVRQFGRVNWIGLYTLSEREIMRFASIWMQSLLAPVVTAVLFVVIFNLAFGAQRGEMAGVPFLYYLAPGICMMMVIQNAFNNSSSSLLLAKIQGNIVDTLMPPLSAAELVAGYAAASVARGAMVAVLIVLAIFVPIGLSIAHPLWLAVYVLLASLLLGLVGLVIGILVEKFDQLNAFTNFVVTPLSFLSGTFYSVEVLPPVMRTITQFNPIHYLIDGMRYGVLGTSDADPVTGLVFNLLLCAAMAGLCWHWFRTGYRLKP